MHDAAARNCKHAALAALRPTTILNANTYAHIEAHLSRPTTACYSTHSGSVRFPPSWAGQGRQAGGACRSGHPLLLCPTPLPWARPFATHVTYDVIRRSPGLADPSRTPRQPGPRRILSLSIHIFCHTASWTGRRGSRRRDASQVSQGRAKSLCWSLLERPPTHKDSTCRVVYLLGSLQRYEGGTEQFRLFIWVYFYCCQNIKCLLQFQMFRYPCCHLLDFIRNCCQCDVAMRNDARPYQDRHGH